MGAFDGTLFRDTAARIELALRKAHADLAPALVSQARTAPNPRLVRQRRGVPGEALGGDGIGVLRIDGRDGRPRGLIVHHAAHPTLLTAKCMELSAGWPGAMRREIEKQVPGATALFLNGAMGDLSPRAGQGKTAWERMESYGRAVAKEALELHALMGDYNFGLLPTLEIEADAAELVAPTAVAHLLGAKPEHALLGTWPISLAAFRIGALRLVTVPGEPSAEVGERLGGSGTWVVSCAMDHLGYFVTPKVFSAANTYEAELSLFGPGIVNRMQHALGGHATETRFAGAPAPSTDGPVVVTGDSPIHLGHAHGHRLRGEIRALLAAAERSLEDDVLKHGGGLLLSPHALLMGTRPRDLVVPLLVRAARRIQPFVPQAYRDEMQGIAEAAGVPYDAVLLENVFLTLAEQPDKTAMLSLPVRCTNVVAMGDATSMGQLLHGSTLDWGMREVLKDRVISLVVEPPDGHPFVSVTWPGMVGTLRAMGAQGIAITEESCAAPEDTTWRGVPINLLMRDVVQHASSLEDAVTRVAEAEGTCGYKVTISDGRSLDARVVEVTAKRHHVRAPRAGLLFGCDPASPCLGACEEGIPRNDGSSARRYPAVRGHLEAVRKQIRAADIQASLALREGGVLNEGTLLACVFEPQLLRFHVASAQNVDAGSGTLRFTTHDLVPLLSAAARPTYAPPWPVRRAGEVETRVKLKSFGGIRVEEITFSSPVRSGTANNDRFIAELYTPKDPVGVVIQLPHWKDPTGAHGQRVIALAMARQGLASLLLPLPWQYGRRPEGKRTGEQTLSADLARTREAAFQGAADAGRASLWLEEARGYAPARQGIMGLSLGGHTASLAYGAYPKRFEAAAFLLAGSHEGGGLFRENGITDRIVRQLKSRGVTIEEAFGLLGPIDPAALAIPALADRVLIVAGDRDPVVPKASVQALSRAWGGAQIRYFKGGHYEVVRYAPTILKTVAEHFRALFEAD